MNEIKLYGPNGEELNLSKFNPRKNSLSFPTGFFISVLTVALLFSLRFYWVNSKKPTDDAASMSLNDPSVDAAHGWMIPPEHETPKDATFKTIRVYRWVSNSTVRSEDWKIRYTTVAALGSLGCRAYTSTSWQTIYMPADTDLNDRQELMIHELMHVALYAAGGPNKAFAEYGAEESQINPSAPQLAAILRNNPDLAKWLALEESRHAKVKP
jgi:hypothetical protein